AVRLLEPFVVAARWDDASMSLECVSKHRLVGDAFCTGVKACRQLLQGLFPPPRNESPAHGDKFGRTASSLLHDRYRVRRRDVVVGRKIGGRTVRKVIQVLNVVPGVALNESTAHGAQPQPL